MPFRLALILCAVVSLLAGCGVTKLPISGNGVGYGGGDPLFGRISQASRTLHSGLLHLSGPSGGNPCQAVEAHSDLPAAVSARLNQMTADKLVYCRQVLSAKAQALAGFFSRAPEEMVQFVTSPLEVEEGGSSVRVIARTELGPAGKILLNRDAIERMADIELAALLVHEAGHKISMGQGYLSDEAAEAPFDGAGGGRALLDLIGAAAALYSHRLAHPEPIRTHTGVVDAFWYNGNNRSERLSVRLPQACPNARFRLEPQVTSILCGTGGSSRLCASGSGSDRQPIWAGGQKNSADSFEFWLEAGEGVWVGSYSPPHPIRYEISCYL